MESVEATERNVSYLPSMARVEKLVRGTNLEVRVELAAFAPLSLPRIRSQGYYGFRTPQEILFRTNVGAHFRTLLSESIHEAIVVIRSRSRFDVASRGGCLGSDRESHSDVMAVSKPLRDGIDDSQENDHKEVHNHQPLPSHGTGGEQDDAVQTSVGPLTNTWDGPRFPGVGATLYAPPDTNMAVGPNHIHQTVNSRYAIYTKSGTLVAGPNSLSSLWAPLGSANGCATNNAGDVVAQYDKLADRFLVT